MDAGSARGEPEARPTSAPSLDVLALQAEHLRQQADMIRQHLITHGSHTGGMAGLHIETAASHCRSIGLLASHVRSGCTCAIEAQKPLPVCANDGKGGAA